MYYVVYSLLYLLSLLPLRVLYVLSNFFYWLIYHVFAYRIAVVRKNLETAFPEKTEEERRTIEKKFYQNFIDNFIETIKLISGGEAFARKHFLLDTSVMQDQYKTGRKLQVHLGHNFNWELANIAVTSTTSYQPLIVYMPIKNKALDRIFMKIRTQSGNGLLPATDMKNALLPYRQTQYALMLVADQVPGNEKRAYWLSFFGKPTPFQRGPERGAAAGDLAVLFASIYKVKRGYYQLQLDLCTESASSLPEGEITRRYVRYLENAIRKHPDMWLWSHRRWKKEWKDEYSHLWIDTTPPPPES